MSESPSETHDMTVSDQQYAHKSTHRARAALHGAFWSVITAIVPTGLNSLVFIVSSRYLMPHDFGIFALAVSAVSLASAFAPAALGEALIQKIHVRKTHLDTVFWTCMATSVLIYLALMLFTTLITSSFGQPVVSAFLQILGLKIIFDLGAAVPNALIARSMSFHLVAARTIIATVISSAICLGLLVSGFGIWALVASLLSNSIIGCVTAFAAAKWFPGFDINMHALKDLSHYGIFASANRFLQLMSLDQIFIGSFMGPAMLGIFNFSRRLFQMVNDVIAGALTSVSHTLFSSLQEQKEKVREAFLIATYGSSLVSFPAFIGLASVVGDAIPLIFGAHWNEAVIPARWFCLIGLMSCIGMIQSSLINSQGKSHWWFYYQLGRQLLTLVTIVLMKDRGVGEIVMALALQTLLCWPLTILMVSRIIQLRLVAYLRQFVEPLFASLVMMASILLLSELMQGNSPAERLVVEIGFGALVYAFSIFIISREKLLVMFESFLNRKKHQPI